MQIFNAYIDGFNLYMGALKGRPELKWLDLVTFCQAARPEMQLGKIYFFTAAISERYPGDDAPRRQEKYLRVLANQGINVVRGRFQKKTKWLRIGSYKRTEVLQPPLSSLAGLTQLALNKSVRAASPNVPKAHVIEMKEKGSDVNLGAYLLRDAYENSLDGALVVTGDSDLVVPITFAVRAGLNVKVLVPNRRHPCFELRSAANSLEHISQAMLTECQLPKTYVSPTGKTITKPGNWA